MSTIERFERGPRHSRVVVHGGTAYFSGLTATDATGSIEDQTRQILEKADALLATLGVDRSSLICANIWLRDIGDFGAMNRVWEGWIDPEHPPARATVESSLALPQLLIEIQFQAAVD
ncbi:MAG: RidA family protein [Brevundimonas sp.]